MAKNPIKVMSSITSDTIIAGRVNPKTNMFIGEREDVTDSAISAVASHLISKEVEYKFKLGSKKYSLRCIELEQDE